MRRDSRQKLGKGRDAHMFVKCSRAFSYEAAQAGAAGEERSSKVWLTGLEGAGAGRQKASVESVGSTFLGVGAEEGSTGCAAAQSGRGFGGPMNS